MFEDERIASASTIKSVLASVDYQEIITNALIDRQIILSEALINLTMQGAILTGVAQLLVEALRSRHRVLVAGNGGSAAEAQHFASEFVGRFRRERAPYAVLSLTTDTSILTALANDYGYRDVFARQVFAFGQSGDILIAFSTSGESENLVEAARVAQQRLLTVIALTGNQSSRLEGLSNLTVRMPVADKAIAQELHLIVIHILCDIVELELSKVEKEIAG